MLYRGLVKTLGHLVTCKRYKMTPQAILRKKIFFENTWKIFDSRGQRSDQSGTRKGHIKKCKDAKSS